MNSHNNYKIIENKTSTFRNINILIYVYFTKTYKNEWWVTPSFMPRVPSG